MLFESLLIFKASPEVTFVSILEKLKSLIMTSQSAVGDPGKGLLNQKIRFKLSRSSSIAALSAAPLRSL